MRGPNEASQLRTSDPIAEVTVYNGLFLKRNYSVDMVLLLQYLYYQFLRLTGSNSCQG